ncbi:CBS domain-containing protein [Methanolinea mesophila]|uniref:CBS domain-containing protein n=1 Tax=Methanolinea mesophila TaxID=547055 RepID=UPI001AE7C246|nr:CBS domain-containing protein [Methanolinea mesophila]MBP1929425.1 CBS domain-containing protein [Methanolinea mesophila]
MRADDIMTAPVHVVAANENVAHARNLMLKHKISRLPVMDGDCLTGIITKKDIGYRLRQTEPHWRRRPIDHIPISVLMTCNPLTVGPETSIAELAGIMIEWDISGLPVMEETSLVGIVTKSDLMKSAMVGKLSTHVEDVMEDAITVSRYHSLDHVIDLMKERNDKVIVVNNDGTLAGIITESNLAFFLYETERRELPQKDVKILRREESAGKKVFRYVFETSAIAEDLMSRPVVTIPPGAPLSEAVTLMRDQHVNSMVVLDGTEIRGILKRDDIIREVAQ